MNNHRERMLGCLPSKHDPRTLRLRDYRPAAPLPPPPSIDWAKCVTEWLVGGNNRYGNCVIVTAAHMLLAWKANACQDPIPIPDADVIALSREMGAMDGYNILHRQVYWRKTGMWGNKTWAFAQIDPANAEETKTAVWEFGAADIALQLPSAWQADNVWDIGSGPRYRPGSWGGHSVPVVAYDTQYAYVVTWGTLQKITFAALARYSDEAYAVIDQTWLAKNGTTPSALDLPKLHADLHAITL